MRLSIVATLYRSAPQLDEFYRRVKAVAEQTTPHHEIVLVNDGSPDDSLAAAIRLQARDPHVRVVDLSRNFGHHKAMMAGLAHARGELVFLLDSDLEEEPELFPSFQETLQRNACDVVYGVQARRKGRLFERVAGALFFRLFNALSTHRLPPNLITMRLMTRRYVDTLLTLEERETIISGLWVLAGFEQVPLTVMKGSRDDTSYGLGRKLLLLVDSVTSFSDRPLVFVFFLGLAISSLASLAALYLVVRRLFFGVLLAGWPSLIVSVWLLGGLTLFCLGIIGVYLSRVFIETKKRPNYIVRHVYEHRST
jgi:putative glycosyltransferase